MLKNADIPTAEAPSVIRIAHCLLDVDGTVISESGDASADTPFYAASTIKLHVALAATRAAADGLLQLDEQIPVTRTVPGFDGQSVRLSGDHLTAEEPQEGAATSIRELITQAIRISSNTATNQLIHLVGLTAIEDMIRSLGLARTRVERLIGDPAALAQGRTNETTARDLARTVHAILHEPGEGAAIIRAAMTAQEYPVILTVLRAGATGGSKSGDVDGYRHDVAFVHADGEDPARSRILAVMTAGLPQADADERIRGLARELLPVAECAGGSEVVAEW